MPKPTIMKSCCAKGPYVLLVLTILTACQAGVAQSWLQEMHDHYSIFYQQGSAPDVTFMQTWMDRAQALMREKYGVSPDGYEISLYLLPEAAGDINPQQSGQNQCCTMPGDSGKKTGTIRMLTPSAPIWRQANLVSSLGLPKAGEDYHAKVLMSEYIPIGHYAAQDSRPTGGWSYYSAPEWFVQGLQEYDGIFHTTAANRDTTSKRLLDWAGRNRSTFALKAGELQIGDAYNGGAAFMTFLASEFGEKIHSRLLRSPAPTFEDALTSETAPYSRQELFEGFQRWLDSAIAR